MKRDLDEAREVLEDLIERLYVHDELAADGLTGQWDLLTDEQAWEESWDPYLDKLQELIDTAELILGAYEEV